jgi:REP element-mobilizing transposase RayT
VTNKQGEINMPQSLVKMLVHIVFSTKNRANLITPEIEPELFSYMNGIVGNNKSKLIIANGTMNHVHLLVSLGKTISVSELIGDIKRDSSSWIKPKGKEFRDFYWQEGYGAFSVGQTQVKDVMNYIARQKEKHAKRSFETEFRYFLKKYEIEYDERYVWD